MQLLLHFRFSNNHRILPQVSAIDAPAYYRNSFITRQQQHMKNLAALLMLCCCALMAHAQNNFKITGKLTDEQDTPVELANVVLKTAADTAVVGLVYSEANGAYAFEGLAAQTYVLEITYVGFEKWTSEPIKINQNTPVVQMPVIKLRQSAALLKEATVTAKAQYIERKIDRTVVNVDALIANAGSSALEALERSPGISLDPNGTLKLKGRAGVLVFIDDKPTYLSGTELENYLRSIPASNIKQIEIMTNPPAKYEAAGNAGVINIITKRNKLPGFNGNAVLNFTRGQYSRSNNSLNLNINRQKFSLYTNLNAGIRNSFQDLNINRYYKNPDLTPSSSFSQNSYIQPSSHTVNAKIGLDYYLSDKTTLGVVVKGLLNPGEVDTDNFAAVLNPQQDTLQTIIADNKQKNRFSNGTYNINLRHNLDSLGSNIIIDADYVTYSSDNDQVFKNYLYDSNGSLTYSDLINGSLPSSIAIYAAKADYTKPLKGNSKFEAGWKSAFTKTDNEAAYTNTVENITTIDYDLSNRFLYDEWIHAAYVNYAKSFGKIEFQLGLRAETTRLKGNQLGNAERPGSKFSRSYTNVFPTFFASWHLDSLDRNVLTFSYGKRIDRPFFQDLNPFISPLDKFTFYSGNPDLLPTYSNNLSLSHSFKGFINTTLNYSKTIDGINETLEIADGIYYSRPGNIANSEAISLSLDATISVAKWYNIMLYAEAGYLSYESQLYTEQLNSGGDYQYISLNNSLQLGKGWSAEVRGDYQSNIVSAQLLIKSWGTLNMAVAKKILKDAGSLKLSANDLLYTRRSDGIINNLRLTDADWNSDLDSRNVSLTFSYRFGKTGNNRPKHTGSGSESEQNRVKG